MARDYLCYYCSKPITFNDKITNPKMDKRIALNPDDHTYHNVGHIGQFVQRSWKVEVGQGVSNIR
jgi:hypothetical protein